MKHVVIMGAGFSRALSDHLPLTDELGTKIAGKLGPTLNRAIPSNFSGGRFESWLSRLAEPQPDLDDADNLVNRALFLRISQDIQEVLSVAQTGAMSSGPPKWWAQRLVGVLHANRSTVATFNYDTLLECAIRFPPRKVWPSGTIVRGIHLVRDRPPPPGRGGWFGPGKAETFKLLKLHGSIDTYWVAGDQTGATINRYSPVDGWNVPNNSDEESRRVLLPGRIPFIVPPAAAKSTFYTNPLTRQLWQEASAAIQLADKVDIVGYSLPPTDLVTSGMLADILTPTRSSVRVVNRASSDVAERLRDLGVHDDRITEISGDNCLASYTEELEGDIDILRRADRQLIERVHRGKMPILITTSGDSAARVAAIHRSNRSTTLRIQVDQFQRFGEFQKPDIVRSPNDELLVASLLESNPPIKNIIATFSDGKEAAVVDAHLLSDKTDWLVLVPSTMPWSP